MRDINMINALRKYEHADNDDLYQAVSSGQLDMTKTFLDDGFDINTTDKCSKIKEGKKIEKRYEEPLLERAILNNNLDMVKLLLQYQPNTVFISGRKQDLLQTSIENQILFNFCPSDLRLIYEGKGDIVGLFKSEFNKSNKKNIEFNKINTKIVQAILKYEVSKDPKFRETDRFKRAFELAKMHNKSNILLAKSRNKSNILKDDESSCVIS